MLLKTIATVHSPFLDKFGTPRQSMIAKTSVSQIILDNRQTAPEMLDGLEKGASIWVLFGFHLNNQKKRITKVHPPRLRGKKIGVLASRSPHRPNPLGLSLAKILKIHKNIIEVSGLDLVNLTPIYDIKPYLPQYDRPQEKQLPWIQKNPFQKLKVKFLKTAFDIVPKAQHASLKKQLREILQEDPRPHAYLEKKDHVYWLKYSNWDVGFLISPPLLTVIEIKRIKNKSNFTL